MPGSFSFFEASGRQNICPSWLLWPTEHLSQLAPRAALQVEGVAFQKVARLDGQHLDGVQFLVEALGEQWGKLASEEKLALFEKAFYQTIQKADESNDSYLARHDVAFEDLMAQKVTMEEVRAYILLRQSQLPGDDRKRIIMESKGELGYDEARRALRLLGARFFQDLQGVPKNAKNKTYDINTTENTSEEAVMMIGETEVYDEEVAFQAMYENGDEDAIFVNDFEESLIETVQESPELASCFTTYLEARTRLKERARGRGFWPMQPGGVKGRGKKGKSGKGKTKSLADRIASSACRRCGQYGHWKRECPLGQSRMEAKPKAETISIAEALHLQEDDTTNAMNQDAELIYELPEAHSDLGLCEQRGLIACDFVFGNTESWKLCQPCPSEHVYFGEVGFGEGTQKHGAPKNTDPGPSTNLGRPLELKTPLLNPRALQQCCRKHGRLMSRSPVDAALTTTAPEITISAEPDSNFPEHAFTLSEECAGEAVIDTGASRTVVGGDRVQELVQVLSPFLKSPIKRVSSAVNFRFGNSGTLQSQYALCIPRRQKGWIRVEVVPGRTPFLVSNAILKELGVLVDPRNQVLRFLDRAGTIPLKTCRKNLLCVSVRDLLNIEDIHNTHHDTEEIYQHELEKQRAKLRRNAKHPSQEFSQSMHAFPVQKPLPSDFIQHGTAKLSAQTDWPPVISVTSTATDGQGHLHQPERYVVPGTESLRRRRSGSPDAEDLHDITEPELQCSSGDSEPPAMGKPCHSLRQEPGQELQPSVRDGQKLCLSDQKSKGSLVLASQLSELHDCPGEVRDEEPGTCATGDSQLCHLDSTAQRKSATESSPEAGKDGRLAGDFRCRDHEEGEEQASQRTEHDG